MPDYTVANTIYPEVEIIPATAASIENVYQDIIDGKAKFRYVLDGATMK